MTNAGATSRSSLTRPDAPPQIAKWYDNQRAKIKRRERLSGSGGGSSEDHDSLSADVEHHQVDSPVGQDDDAADMRAMASFMEMQAARQAAPKTAEDNASTRDHLEDDLHQHHDRHTTDEEEEELSEVERSPNAVRIDQPILRDTHELPEASLLAVRSVSGGDTLPGDATRSRPRPVDQEKDGAEGGVLSEPPVKRIRSAAKTGGDSPGSGSDSEVFSCGGCRREACACTDPNRMRC